MLLPLSASSASACGVMRMIPRFPGERTFDIYIAEAIEREALRAAEAAKKCTDFAGGVDAVDAVKTRGRRAGDVEFVRGVERQVIGRERRFKSGEDENLAFGIDFENRAAAVADVEVAGFIEGEAGGDAHAFNPLHGAAVGGNAVNRAVVAAGNVEESVAIDGEAGGVHHFGDEGLHGVRGGDFVQRDGNFLAALATEGHVSIALRIDGGTRNGMKVVGHLRAEREREWRAFGGAHSYAERAAFGAIGNARDEKILAGENEAALGCSKLHERTRVIARAEAAAVDSEFATGQGGARFHGVNFGSAVQCQRRVPCTAFGLYYFLRRGVCERRLQAGGASEPQADSGVNSGDPIVGHDAPAAGERFGLARGEGLPNIEQPKKYKTYKQIFPVQGGRDRDYSKQNAICIERAMYRFPPQRKSTAEQQRQVLPRDFIDYHSAWNFDSPEYRGTIGSPYADGGDGKGDCNLNQEYRVQPSGSGGYENAGVAMFRHDVDSRNQKECPQWRDSERNACKRSQRSRSFREVTEPARGGDEDRQARLFRRTLRCGAAGVGRGARVSFCVHLCRRGCCCGRDLRKEYRRWRVR